MEIFLSDIGKRFNREWIFRGLTTLFKPGKPVAILGPNGSGKSTLLQVIAGYVQPSKGKITYKGNGSEIKKEFLHKEISISAPYLELLEELTLEESIRFHFRFKNLHHTVSQEEIPALIQLEGNEKKQVGNFSSGMKQRLKLGLAILSDTPLLLLDEPCSNLDEKGKDLYQHLIGMYSENRTVIVCSNNQLEEIFLCSDQISVSDFKSK